MGSDRTCLYGTKELWPWLPWLFLQTGNWLNFTFTMRQLFHLTQGCLSSTRKSKVPQNRSLTLLFVNSSPHPLWRCNPWVLNYFRGDRCPCGFHMLFPPSVWKWPTSNWMSVTYFSSVPFSHSVMSDSETPWIAARHTSPSITNSRSSPKLTSVELVMPSTHLILCRPLLLPPIPPSIRFFSSESTLRMR